MNKNLLPYTLFLFICLQAHGQHHPLLVLSSTALKVSCAWGGKTASAISLENKSNKAMTIKVEKVLNHLSPYQSASFMLGEQLTSADLSTSVNTYTLPPHHQGELFTAYFSAGFKDSHAVVKYRFIDIYNSREIASLTIEYDILEELSEDLFYVSHDINISKLHPNPVVSHATLDYRMASDHNSTVAVLVYNVLGKQVANYPLKPEKHQLLLKFNGWKQGVYFYTLVIDDKNIVTKKFILKH